MCVCVVYARVCVCTRECTRTRMPRHARLSLPTGGSCAHSGLLLKGNVQNQRGPRGRLKSSYPCNSFPCLGIHLQKPCTYVSFWFFCLLVVLVWFFFFFHLFVVSY